MNKNSLGMYLIFLLALGGLSVSQSKLLARQESKAPEQGTKALIDAFEQLLVQYVNCKVEVACDSKLGERVSPTKQFKLKINKDCSSVVLDFEQPSPEPNGSGLSIQQIFDGKQVLRRQIFRYKTEGGNVVEEVLLFAETEPDDAFASQSFLGTGFLFGVDENAKTTWASQLSGATVTAKEVAGSVTKFELKSNNGKRQWRISIDSSDEASVRILDFEWERSDFPDDDKKASSKGTVSDIVYHGKTGRIKSYRESATLTYHIDLGEKSYDSVNIVNITSVEDVESFDATFNDFVPKIEESREINVSGHENSIFRLIDGKITKVSTRKR